MKKLLFIIGLSTIFSCQSKKVSIVQQSSVDSTQVYKQQLIIDSIYTHYERTKEILVERVKADTSKMRIRLDQICDSAIRNALDINYQNSSLNVNIQDGFINVNCITPEQLNASIHEKQRALSSSFRERLDSAHQVYLDKELKSSIKETTRYVKDIWWTVRIVCLAILVTFLLRPFIMNLFRGFISGL